MVMCCWWLCCGLMFCWGWMFGLVWVVVCSVRGGWCWGCSWCILLVVSGVVLVCCLSVFVLWVWICIILSSCFSLVLG